MLFAAPEWEDSYEDALIKAQKEKKMMLVMLSQYGCDACDYMKVVVFEDDDLVDEISKDFVWVIIDVNYDVIPDGLRYFGTPTFHFLSSAGKKLYEAPGYYNIPDFKKEIAAAKKAAGKKASPKE
jgi:thioredoxin-related protein